MDSAIKWFSDRQGKVTYSMDYRNGPKSYDCSSAVYYALIQGGLLPGSTRIGNTDSLFRDLELNGWTQVPEVNGIISARRGDVFIWGVRGSSGGAFGHTGMFLNENDIIHCAYGYNGIHTDNHDWLYRLNGSPENTIYRYTGAAAPTPPTGNSTDQILENGSYIKFDQTYRVDDIRLVGGIWQIRNNILCKNDFTWDENGIPAEPVYEVDSDGYLTPDQTLNVGELFRIPGKYKVLDLGYVSDMWIAEIEWNGLKFWVDVESATEVDGSDQGTPVPPAKPHTPPTVPTPEEPTSENPPENEQPPTNQDEPHEEKPVINPPKENKPMAYSKEDAQELKIATANIQTLVSEIHADKGVQDITDGISKRTKVIVYIICDTLIGLGLIIPGLAVAFNLGSLVQVTALSGVLATAGGFGLTMFGIYKGKK